MLLFSYIFKLPISGCKWGWALKPKGASKAFWENLIVMYMAQCLKSILTKLPMQKQGGVTDALASVVAGGQVQFVRELIFQVAKMASVLSTKV